MQFAGFWDQPLLFACYEWGITVEFRKRQS